ncbi:MAG: GNAT family N-acetyltransferase [Clostridiales bacterium]|nr:GNAT family N-acetyltransferase [Clostridiales bacterium]
MYLSMAADFYASDAVLFHVDDSHFKAAFNELMRSDEYLECFIFEYDGKTAGYALLCKTFSQEAGGMALWIDELYVLPAFRSKGIGHAFFDFLFQQKGSDYKRFRLEVEKENERAAALYQKMGFDFLAYEQMIKDRK